MFHMAFGQAFLWLTSHRTNNGPGLAFVLSAEAGERWLFKIPIPSLPFHRHQSVGHFCHLPVWQYSRDLFNIL